MKAEKSIRIVASGKYLPEVVLSSELEKKYDVPLGWSEKYSGVHSRHHVTFESNGYMGARAIENALDNSDLSLEDIDLIISASASFDYPLPNQASIIKSELKNGNSVTIPTIDVDASCLSFISAFEIASSLLDDESYKTIIIVSSEIASKGINYTNFETLTLFGDGAAAFILQYDENTNSRYIKGLQKTYSEGVYDSIIKGGGNKYFFRDFPYDQDLHSFSMKGLSLLKISLTKLPIFIEEFFENTPYNLMEIDNIIPHQASSKGISILTNLFNFRPNQLKLNLWTHGNCIAASIPMVLHDSITNGEIKRGDTCFLIGTAAGFSIGGILLIY